MENFYESNQKKINQGLEHLREGNKNLNNHKEKIKITKREYYNLDRNNSLSEKILSNLKKMYFH